MNERFVTHAGLGAWAVPEPGFLGHAILAVTVFMVRRARPGLSGMPRTQTRHFPRRRLAGTLTAR